MLACNGERLLHNWAGSGECETGIPDSVVGFWGLFCKERITLPHLAGLDAQRQSSMQTAPLDAFRARAGAGSAGAGAALDDSRSLAASRCDDDGVRLAVGQGSGVHTDMVSTSVALSCRARDRGTLLAAHRRDWVGCCVWRRHACKGAEMSMASQWIDGGGGHLRWCGFRGARML